MQNGHGCSIIRGVLQATPVWKKHPRARSPTFLIEPIWQQFRALLPTREANHPLGCHRRRIPDRVLFLKLVEVLVFGCSYWRIADETCSATTLRRRREGWIEAGLMDSLEGIALEV